MVRSVAVAHTFSDLAFHRGRFAAAVQELGGTPPAMDMLSCFPSEVEESVAIGSYLQPLLDLRQLQSMFETVTIRVAEPSEQNPLASAVLISGQQPSDVGRCIEYVSSHVQDLAKDYTEITLEVEHRVQLHLAGGGPEGSGSNMRTLCQQYPGVTIDLPTGLSPSARIMIRGRAASVTAVQAVVQAQVAELSELHSEVHHPLPKEYHVHVVGHEGSMITHIQDTTGATVMVPHDSEESHYVTISGQHAEVEAATAMVEQLRARISSSNGGGGNPAASSATPASPGSGPAQHSTHNQGHYHNLHPTSPPHTPGSPRNAGTTGGTVSAPHSPSPLTDTDVDAAEVIIEVQAPEKFHRYLIGARGTTMKQIQNESGCMIFFPNTKNAPARVRPSSEDVVVCVGTQHACDRAQELILARVTDCHRDTGGSRDSAYLRLLHDMRERRQTQEFAGEVQVKVAAELHGFVVGGRGFVLKEIQAESGARVYLPTTKTAPARARAAGKDVITIMGSQGACAIAKQLVMARAEDAENGRRSKEDSAYMNMLQDLRSKSGAEKYATNGGASSASSPDPHGHGQHRGSGGAAHGGGGGGSGGGGGGGSSNSSVPEGKVCDECFVATEGLELDPDHPDCYYCQPCWSQWRSAYGTADVSSATAATPPQPPRTPPTSPPPAAAVAGSPQSAAVHTPSATHSPAHVPAPSPSPPPAVAAAVHSAGSPLGSVPATAAGSPRSPPTSPHSQPSTSPIGSSRNSAHNTPLTSPAPGSAVGMGGTQYSQSPSISPPQPPLNEQQGNRWNGGGSGGGGSGGGSGTVSGPGSPSSNGPPSMGQIEEAFSVSSAWNTSPRLIEQAPAPEPTWVSPALDELGAAAAWSSATLPPFSSWGSPSHGGGGSAGAGADSSAGGNGSSAVGQQQPQQQQQQQQHHHHTQHQFGMVDPPPDALSTQLYASIIKDGINASEANQVMEMLARLPVESMHTCLTDDALRRRMVKRCLQKLSEGAALT